MAKVQKVEYGIDIVKPWSKEMYAHNDKVQEVVIDIIESMWTEATDSAQVEFEEDLEEDQQGLDVGDCEWGSGMVAWEELARIQSAVTCYGFGWGYTLNDVEDEVMKELHNAAYWRLNEMVDELDIELEEGFVGFN